MLLSIYTSFLQAKVDIDPLTLSFYGNTEGYSDAKRDSGISFRLDNADDSQSELERLRSILGGNPEYIKPEDYIKLKAEFESYETDKRPRFWIRLTSGSRGMTNPPQFNFVTK